MGEIAEAMLDGTLCAGCGEALVDGADDEPAGFPQYCSDKCARDHGADPDQVLVGPRVKRTANQKRAQRQNNERERIADAKRGPKKFRCDKCHKGFRSPGALKMHVEASHTGTSAIRLKRTGRTISFFEVAMGCVFFARDAFWVRMTNFAAARLSTSENLNAECRGFAASVAPGEDQSETCELVEAVIVEGNDRRLQ